MDKLQNLSIHIHKPFKRFNYEGKNKKMDLANMNKVEAPKLDVSQYVGQKVNIENVSPIETQFGVAIKVETVVLDEIETAEGKENIILRASRIFSVSKEGDIIVGSKLDKFMTKQGVDQPLKLIGTVVQVIKNDKDFLTF